jgi:hypothetical protein
MDKDKFGSSGTFQGGKFTPFDGAAAKQEAAESAASQAAAEREERRKELDEKSPDALRQEYAHLNPPASGKKADLIEFILDEG